MTNKEKVRLSMVIVKACADRILIKKYLRGEVGIEELEKRGIKLCKPI